MPLPEDLCMGCMAEHTGWPCSECGWKEGTPPESPAYLPPRTVLDNRYLLGKVLGAGGFGITYLAWDLNLDIKLAIKEYFPAAAGLRSHQHSTVVPANTQSRAAFAHGLAKFLEEGRALARFHGHPGIASVMTFFNANNTSYIVMKFEDGHTLEDEIQKKGGRLAFDETAAIAMHVMDALRAVHAEGILHRDISPDNIVINRHGQIKILDFGSAKREMTVRETTMQMTLKRGFSPEEQYHASGRQGPWTDVYAVAATIYKCLTGERPPEALDRLNEDNIRRPSEFGVRMPAKCERALMRALAVRAADRYQTIAEFQQAFAPEPDRDDRRPNQFALWLHKHRGVVAGATAGVLALGAALWILSGLLVAPRIREFVVDPPMVAPGKPVTLRWSASGRSVSIVPGIGAVAQTVGAREVVPRGTTTYTLTARGPLRSTAQSATVTVTANPIAINFTAEPATIKRGDSAELVWSVSGDSKTVNIEPGVGRVGPTGRLKVSPSADTTYTLTAAGPTGPPIPASVTILMQAPVPKPDILSLDANPVSVRKGQVAVLNWAVAGENVLASFDQNIGRVKLKDSVSVSPAVTTTYKLQARNPGGVTSKTVTVEVVQPQAPTIRTFKISPETIAFGQAATLSWSVGGEFDSVRIVPGLETAPAEGTQRVAPETTTTYKITATGPGGAVSDEATVRVSAPRPTVIQSFSANSTLVGPKETVVLQWNVVGDVEKVTLLPGDVPLRNSGEMKVNPEVTTKYTLRANGPGGLRTSTIEVQVSSEPLRIIAFDAKPNKVKRGKPVTLTWKFSGPIVAAAIQPNVGNLTYPSGSVDVMPDRNTEYVLTIQTASRSASKSVKVVVSK